MNFDPDFLASARSDGELMERVENRQKYMPETIEASLTELQRRGKDFSDEEVRYIREDIAARRSHAAAMTGRVGIFNSDYKNVIVEDPDAPKMYSTLAIYLFTFFMGPFFGSVMMAMNISKTGKSNAVVGVILFGIGFAILGVCLMGYGSPGTLQIICGLVGAYFLNYLFWRPYIGFGTFYRARPIWGALAIAVALAALLIFSLVSDPNYTNIAH